MEELTLQQRKDLYDARYAELLAEFRKGINQ